MSDGEELGEDDVDYDDVSGVFGVKLSLATMLTIPSLSRSLLSSTERNSETAEEIEVAATPNATETTRTERLSALKVLIPPLTSCPIPSWRDHPLLLRQTRVFISDANIHVDILAEKVSVTVSAWTICAMQRERAVVHSMKSPLT